MCLNVQPDLEEVPGSSATSQLWWQTSLSRGSEVAFLTLCKDHKWLSPRPACSLCYSSSASCLAPSLPLPKSRIASLLDLLFRSRPFSCWSPSMYFLWRDPGSFPTSFPNSSLNHLQGPPIGRVHVWAVGSSCVYSGPPLHRAGFKCQLYLSVTIKTATFDLSCLKCWRLQCQWNNWLQRASQPLLEMCVLVGPSPRKWQEWHAGGKRVSTWPLIWLIKRLRIKDGRCLVVPWGRGISAG